MWIAYFDASALIKRYTPEVGSLVVDELFHQLPLSQIACSLITTLEVASILVRKRNDGRLMPEDYQQASVEFQSEVFGQGDMVLTSVDDALLQAAMPFLIAHNINATDTIILRSALDFQAAVQAGGEDVMFWTSDRRLARAARAEGLTVFDPETDTVEDLRNLLNRSEES